jgi:hypothetical protein
VVVSSRDATDVLASLRVALEKATPGPWQCHAEAVGQSALGVEKGRGQGLVERTIHTAQPHPQLGGPAPIVTTASGPYVERTYIHIRDVDAALIVLLRNHGPALVSLASCFARLVEANDARNDGRDGERTDVVYAECRAALACLAEGAER